MAVRKLVKSAAISGAVLAGVSVGAGVACTGALAWLAVAGARKRLPFRFLGKSTDLRNSSADRSKGPLQGKVVLITGSSRGLGLALAEEFGRLGAKLALNARDEEELERARALLLSRLDANHEEIFIVPGDLREAEEADRVIQQTTSHFGQIDVLVNNAGVITVGPIESQSIEDFRDAMNGNFFSGLHCTLAALPQMLERGHGNIVNIASIGGKIAVPHLLPYTASKFAAVGFSEGLNSELRAKGIKVTTVCPGLMRTGSHLNAVFTGDAAREYRWFSLGAGLPGLSASAKSAARKIVRATIAGTSEIAITPQAMIASRLGNVCPTLTMRAMQGMNFALPQSGGGNTTKHRGAEVREFELKPATAFGEAAARRYNQSQ